MKQYIIKDTDIMHKGIIFPEGSTIDLEDKDAESLSYYLIESKPKLELDPKPELEHKPLVLNSFQDQPKSKTENKKRSK